MENEEMHLVIKTEPEWGYIKEELDLEFEIDNRDINVKCEQYDDVTIEEDKKIHIKTEPQSPTSEVNFESDLLLPENHGIVPYSNFSKPAYIEESTKDVKVTVEPKKANESVEVKRKKVKTTIEMKKEIIRKHESGVRVSDLALQFGLAKSSISTILKNKEVIKDANVAKGVTVITKQRSQTLEEVEKLLLIWINEKQLAGNSLSKAIICEKARLLYQDLLKKTPGSSFEIDRFKASRGWFEKFKKRSGIHSIVHHGEALSANKKDAEDFVKEFCAYVAAEGFIPQQVFNCGETGLFWKKMPNSTYLMQEVKDRLTLLLCGNASGDFKVKPLLVYHLENPDVFKRNNVVKNKLSVMWRANSKAWVTRQFFLEWVHEVFAPSVRKYLNENNLPLKCLLLLDNAPAHPPGMEAELLGECDFIVMKFLPPNITSIIQPMDQQIISNFKKYYTKALFQRCFEVTSDTELTLCDFWKNHFNILLCLGLIDKAWQQVTCRTLNLAWRNLWPDCVAVSDFEGFETDTDGVVDDIVYLGKSMGLEVNNADIEELVKEHSPELSTDELELLQKEQQKEVLKEIPSEEEEGREDVPIALINKMCAKWSEVQSFVERYHPDNAVASRVINLFNDNAMSHFHNIVKRRQNQISLDRVLVKKKPSESQAKSAMKKQEIQEVREKTPEVQLLDAVLEGDSPSKK
ncbi:tigger transposable element-derived protein 1-like isoform X1 [Centruroides sculpturatus]|uniref:tigger transposable element-derived protein 1-like isoform X1 n=1 Tax=Centruroides sculpturatus TaxID=218467 RepID=UPI000C6EF57A|nr:tigger transposable element-derived protein 1-like isoform X1 [Centruroides sculpturatus]XP_023230983.1 tigger transposable element-derived protein 1-like isoform X1 [Centruroides sculpturatus]XP_023230984.1 tigger transposable element-derived protein 1-like isoform X1 [Centruroides sculpturatus]XP_023230985.1 tigger transposable element-derived protein 1-like isoform X1 [Centruroides sculpturatus]